jgi:hypothetical protein
MASRDSEVRAVVTQLDAILAALRTNVDELTGILTRPAPGEQDERLAPP